MSKFKVGDKARFVNDYGVDWGIVEIVEVVDSPYGLPADGEKAYYITPTDTPWFAMPERLLIKINDGGEHHEKI